MFTNDESERAERSWYKPRRLTRDSLSSIIGEIVCSRGEREGRSEREVVLYAATESSLFLRLYLSRAKKKRQNPLTAFRSGITRNNNQRSFCFCAALVYCWSLVFLGDVLFDFFSALKMLK